MLSATDAANRLIKEEEKETREQNLLSTCKAIKSFNYGTMEGTKDVLMALNIKCRKFASQYESLPEKDVEALTVYIYERFKTLIEDVTNVFDTYKPSVSVKKIHSSSSFS